MGYYSYCKKCEEGIHRPDLEELKQGYVECDHCGEHWDDINQIEALFELIEELQEDIKDIKEKKDEE